MRHLIALALVACKSSTPSPPTNTKPVSGGPPGTWTYTAALDAEGDGKTTQHRVTLTETGRKKLAGATVIELTVALDGKPLDEKSLEAFGHPPFSSITPKLWLVAKGDMLRFELGDGDFDETKIAALPKDKATWMAGTRDVEPAEPPMDEDYAFAKKIKTWDSTCSSYIHPSPDSGDTFSSERCFAPNVGITHLEFSSVWGGYDLTLETAPASFSVD